MAAWSHRQAVGFSRFKHPQHPLLPNPTPLQVGDRSTAGSWNTSDVARFVPERFEIRQSHLVLRAIRGTLRVDDVVKCCYRHPSYPPAQPAMLMPTVAVINALPVSNDLISTRFLGRGNRLLVRFSDFVPFEFVRLIVASTPQVVGTGYADAQGNVEFTGTFPIGLEPGDHRLIVFAPTSGRGASQSIYAIRRRTRRDLNPVCGNDSGSGWATVRS